jgi:hypothetical protein
MPRVKIPSRMALDAVQQSAVVGDDLVVAPVVVADAVYVQVDVDLPYTLHDSRELAPDLLGHVALTRCRLLSSLRRCQPDRTAPAGANAGNLDP